MTTLGGVYAAGDDVRGSDLTVTAIAAGREAVQAMDDYLRAIPTGATNNILTLSKNQALSSPN